MAAWRPEATCDTPASLSTLSRRVADAARTSSETRGMLGVDERLESTKAPTRKSMKRSPPCWAAGFSESVVVVVVGRATTSDLLAAGTICISCLTSEAACSMGNSPNIGMLSQEQSMAMPSISAKAPGNPGAVVAAWLMDCTSLVRTLIFLRSSPVSMVCLLIISSCLRSSSRLYDS